MIFIGIDLAWTYKNETGICIIDDSGHVLRHSAAVFSDQELTDMIMTHGKKEEVSVGIDAALIVNNVDGSRPAEGLMMRDNFHGHRLQAFNSNRSYLEKVFKVLRGEEIVKLVLQACHEAKVTHVFGDAPIRMIETFPTGICVGLFPELYPIKYKIKGKVPFDQSKLEMVRLLRRLKGLEGEEGLVGKEGVEPLIGGLSELVGIRGIVEDWLLRLDGIGRKGYKQLEDEVDAFLCAYGLYVVWHGTAEQRIYGDEKDGFMMVPVKRIPKS